ncbi:hypothetical protein JG687_00001847 [Phytophthora cactorum]|uniref:Uncharacterized protein n=1 Tax=Phytophthora cactorum TaxID=29920 RepID=A0A8T1UW94_9STRA|nr:hypothetical protein JG687_00001847 [Phytophthora cactorum]
MDACEAIIRELFSDTMDKIVVMYEKSLKQTDTVSSGLLMLHFLECTVRGIKLPDHVPTNLL